MKCQLNDIYLYLMGRIKEKPEIDETTLGPNPYLNLFKVIVSSIKSDNKYKVHDAKSDEQVYELANFEFEATPYCKVYIDADRRKLMSSLSARGKDLYLWLIYETKRGKEYLWINKKRYMEECRVSSLNTYKAALNELLMAGLLMRAIPTDTYWLSPHHFFNGNRITKFPKNIIKR